MPSIPTYDVSTSNKGAEWDKFSRALYSYMEDYALGYNQQNEITAYASISCFWGRDYKLAVSSKMETVGNGKLSETCYGRCY